MNFMQKLAVGAGSIAALALIVGSFWVYFYSLTSPEAYVAVQRWEAIIGYGIGLPIMIAIIAFASSCPIRVVR